MITEKKCLDLITQFNATGREKTFAEFISVLFKDQFIEIYVGDSYETVNFEQHSTQLPAVLCGKVVGAFKECLIINAGYKASGGKESKLGNILFVNERGIRALTVVDGNGNIEESILTSKDTLGVAKNFG